MIDLKVHIIRNHEIFEPLEPMLMSWLHVAREYTYRVPKDLQNPDNLDYCWWHGERPQVGFFSIAAWLNGWAVLQEWGMQKKESSGRNDLWLGRGQSEFFIEAKHGWCFIDRGKHGIEKDIINHLDAAKSSAAALIPTSGCKVAAAFISPVYRETEDLPFEAARQLWMQELTTAADAVALIAPCLDECPEDKNKNKCVGSALLLAKV